ncbi:MAG: UDP-N-acetylglucosamine 1-carboxyvinyltransferase [Armatimonadota bacterium]|nr:UDP-N-acetylglucosamine 1-carboxyvinyltransferase [Armatimonadota bacterium]MDR7422966.1 UDP-N-acetylglucosamine 1-carboxyvinyltransferase [Armatimonadota bacterium]MDR7456878.1 UDP-N-acetylglucosamine 1-carboxyvinyltransferase [Armatimonadota bacterium]MDR7495609.1 UDP-N-acetylglucosamine 1-carboxyvinyltransferase [Armatimonadota bacterium]MDR7511880.1 UDP-N-acetylglucosamine 1-carboxyvinyltransferase [Armatimonadota bacterium]
MGTLIVSGGRRLRGAVRVAGGKNSSLAVIAAAALAPDVSTLDNVPACRDVATLVAILEALGVRVSRAGGRLTIDARGLRGHVAPYDLCRSMRASFYTAGVLLGRSGRAQVPLPGGCSIGARPVDFHLRGFAALGARVATEHGYMKASTRRLKGTSFYVPRSSVGTTINLMMAATTARGTTVLQNAAREPEVVDCAVFLNLMGARVRGAGTDTITIEGVATLHGNAYTIIPDRLEAGTYLLAGAATGGDVLVEGMIPEHVTALLTKLEEAGAEVVRDTDGVRVRGGELRAVDVDTAPYPGFATDLHPQMVAVLTQARGTSTIRETIFEARFAYTDELRRMGADIKVEGESVHVTGPARLTGAPVEAPDIRGGAAVLIGALAAAGDTEIAQVENLDRGYEGLEAKLTALGARVARGGAMRAAEAGG